MIAVTPLVVCALVCILFSLIPTTLGFASGFLRGLLIGLGMGALLPLAHGARKQNVPRKILWLPAAFLSILLAYQYLTFKGMLSIPALYFLNVTAVDSRHMIETSILTFLSCLLFITRKPA